MREGNCTQHLCRLAPACIHVEYDAEVSKNGGLLHLRVPESKWLSVEMTSELVLIDSPPCADVVMVYMS